MPAGRHGHKMREFKRRIETLVEADRQRQKPPPPPISEKHAAMRDRIERTMGALDEQIPEGTDFEEAMEQIPEVADLSLDMLVMEREEVEFLVSYGVDPRPYQRHERKL